MKRIIPPTGSFCWGNGVRAKCQSNLLWHLALPPLIVKLDVFLFEGEARLVLDSIDVKNTVQVVEFMLEYRGKKAVCLLA